MAPLRGLLGLGGGGFQRNAGSDLGPTNPADYPLTAGQYSTYTTAWPGSPPNLPVSDGPTTFTVPSANRGYIRVIAVGGSSGGAPAQGDGARVDALIPVNTGDRFKVIVGGGGATGSSGAPPSQGGNGCGGGCGTDSNDSGSGGAGTGFFYAEPGATSDPAMFPKGVLIAGGGGGGGGACNAGSDPAGPSPTTIGGFNGIWRGGNPGPSIGEPGQAGGQGGRVKDLNGPLRGSNAARGVGGSQQSESYPNCNGGTGGGAGAGGYGGDCNPGASPNQAEPSPSGRGRGYDALNASGAGRGGDYPMRGGNGFTFQGVDLGGGSGGSHGAANAGGGWGGGGGAYYDMTGGSGGSGAWGYVPGTASINAWVASNSIPVNGGTINSVMGVPTSLGGTNGAPGYVVVMW